MRASARVALSVGLVVFGWLAPAAAQPEKYSLTMFHFNVQYVAGGLSGFPSGSDTNPAFELDNDAVEDWIIVESFEPVLDLFLAHSNWKVTLEMQAYMVEVMEQRHPLVLGKLKLLVERTQAELVSFHYSDQLFLAYPPLDLERSHELADEVWQRVGLQPSAVVFCQEGQFGVGMIPFGLARGRSIFVLPKNLFRYQHAADFDAAPPWFDLEGADVILGARSFATPEVEVRWSFFDDGELLATGGQAPYMGKNFLHDPAAVAAYEQELLQQEAEGFQIATVTEMVSALRRLGVSKPTLPPMLDGTWQPSSTDSMHRWMGAAGLLDVAYGCERDGAVLTGNVRARHWITVAEALLAEAQRQELSDLEELPAHLAGCWRDVLLAEVSDASGINPFLNEVRYGLDRAEAAAECAATAINLLDKRLGGPVLAVDTASGEVLEMDDIPSDLPRETTPLFQAADGFAVEAPGRELVVSWLAVGTDDTRARLEIEAGLPADGQRSLKVDFPLRLSALRLTPALVDDQVSELPLASFDFEEGRITVPLANGLLGLDDDLWLVKQTSAVHAGARLYPDEGRVSFEDQTLAPDEPVRWAFWFVRGDATAALALADRLNLHPTAYLETGVGRDRGCGCAAANSAGAPLPLVLGLLWGVWRRRYLRR